MKNLFAAIGALCLLLSLGDAASLVKPGLQQEHCSWGAQYWCSSPETASLCGKTEWCAHNDWPYDVVQDLSCTAVQTVITNTRSLIQKSAQKPVSEYDFAMFLARSCTFFMDDKERHQCKELVTSKDVLPKLVQLVDSQLSVKSVATAVGVCQKKKNIPADKPCLRCPEMVSSVQKLLSKFLTQDAFMKLIEPQCAKLGQGRHLCRTIGQAKFADFYNALINAPATSVCEGVTQCLSVSSGLQSVQASTECDTCKAVVKEIRELDRSPVVQTVLQNLIKSVCAKLGAFAQMCDILADEELEHLSELIATEMEPDVICEELKLCGQPEQKAVQSSSPVGADIECPVCEMIFQEIDLAIGSNTTQDKLEKLLTNDFCNRLPAPINSQCRDFVKTYSPQLIHVFVNDLDPKSICSILGLCKNATSILQFKPRSETPKQPSNTTCSLCKYVVVYLETFLEKNATQAEIEALLEKVCTMLPQNYSQECDALVRQYGPLIVQLLLAELKPERVCEVLGLCSPQKLAFSQVKTQLRQPNDEVCDVCKYVVTYLDTFLDKNSTQSEIEALLDKVCEILPTNWSGQCVNLVEAYGPLIIQLLIGELQPEQVCKVINLCPPNKHGALPHVAAPVLKMSSPEVGKQKTELCALCESVTLVLENILKEKATQAEVVSALDKICDLLPEKDKEPCVQLLPLYTGYIIDLINQELPAKLVCKLMKVCVDDEVTETSSQKQSRSLKSGELCPLCLLVFEEVYNIIKENTTKTAIEAALDKVCDVLPSTIKGECNSFVALYLPYVVDLIVQEMPPNQICQYLGLCNASMGQALTLTQGLHTNKVTAKAGELCTLCIYVFEALDKLLVENSSEVEIEAALDHVCNYLSTYKGQCENFVALYTPFAIDLIAKKLTPAQICNEFGLCINATGMKLLAPTNNKKLPAGPQCALCEYIIKYLDTLLAENATEQEIIKALDEVCNLMPSTLKSECLSFVGTYSSLILTLFQNISPDQICSSLGLCSSQVKVKLHAPTNIKKLPAGPQCALCEYIIKYLDTLLAENATEQEIMAALDQVCNLLPTTLKSECVSFVDNYASIILKLLETVSPDQICSRLGLCSSQLKVKLLAPTNNKKLPAGPQCALCEYIIKYLDTLLAENATEQEIMAALDQVCNLLPTTLKSECVSFVDNYASIILKLLETVSPDQICSRLGLCSSQVKVKLLAPTNNKKLPAGPQCALCEYIIKYLDTLLAENATEQEIMAALDQVCNLLPTTLKSECVSFVDNYASIILKLLETVSPDQICSRLGLCSSQVKAALKSLLLASESTTTTTPAPYVEYCSACKFALYDIQTALRFPFWQKQSKAILSSMCGYLKTGQAVCEHLVEDNYAYILDILDGFNFPMEFCQKIDFCEPPAKLDIPADAKKPTGELQCELCDYVVKYLDTMLTQNATVQQIEAALDQLCSMAPSSLKSECVGFVAEYTPAILKYLKTMSPDQVCSVMGLCPSHVKAAPKSLLFASESTTTSTPAPYVEYCSACKFALYDIQTALRFPFWQKQSKAILSSMCGYLKTGQALCEHLVEDNYAYILDILDGFNFPMEFCQKIDFCEPPAQVETETRCSSCKAVVKMLKLQSHQMTSTEEMNALAESTCTMASSNEAFQCKTLLKQHIPQLVQLIAKYEDPTSICEAASLCRSPVKMLYKVLRP